MEIGRRFTACSISRCNSIGVLQRVILKTTTSAAVLRIGDEVGVSGCSISASERIEIADRVLIGSGCLITDSDAHPLDPAARRRNEPPRTAPIVIEEDVFIGARSIVLKGVRIGRGSVIGAGSVVARSIPAGVVAAGNPARVVRALAAESAAP
jgi:acetyltransferase-like isoleucine patch superfamily enzyme